MKVMVKVCSAALSVLAASVVLAQTAGSVPPDYVPSGISPVDAQIQAVKQNYQEVQAAAQAGQQDKQKPMPVHVEKKVGRNDPCPCGSGKKYKQCHGKGI